MSAAVIEEIDLTPYSGKREPVERRTNSPVRRRSRRAGGERGNRLSGIQKAAMMRRFDEEARAAKIPGRRWGATFGMRKSYSRHDRGILDYLAFLAVKERGNVYPTIGAIAAAVGCTTRSVIEGLGRLKAGGWLRWDRRYVETGERGVRGPQVKQTSNFYYLHFKTAAQELLERWKQQSAAKRQASADEAAAAAAGAAQRQQDMEARWAQKKAPSPRSTAAYLDVMSKLNGAGSPAAPSDSS